MGCDTCKSLICVLYILFQSTHPSWGATLQPYSAYIDSSIFQSTHPSWGATISTASAVFPPHISIHAPIVGCDILLISTMKVKRDFNPRTHRGVRLQLILYPIRIDLFQSTHPSWGATSLFLSLLFPL